MFWKPKDIYEYIAPTLALWKYTGLPVYKLEQTRKKIFFQNSGHFFLGSILPIMQIVAFVAYLTFYNFKNVVKDWICLCDSVTTIIQNTSFLFTTYLKRDNISICLSRIDAVQEKVTKFSMKKFNYDQGAKYIVSRGMAKLGVVLTISIVDSTLMIEEPKDYAFRFIFYSGLVYYFISQLTIYVFLSTVSKIYEEFYQSLQCKREQDISISKFYEIVEIHNIIHNLVQDVANEMQYFMFSQFFYEFSLATTDLFWGTRTSIVIISNSGPMYGLCVGVAISIWFFLIAHSIVTTTSFFDQLIEQELQTNEVINNIAQKLNANFIKPYKFDHIMNLNKIMNGFKFSVLGFFPVSRGLAYSMMAGISTYVVYLIQFNQVQRYI